MASGAAALSTAIRAPAPPDGGPVQQPRRTLFTSYPHRVDKLGGVSDRALLKQCLEALAPGATAQMALVLVPDKHADKYAQGKRPNQGKRGIFFNPADNGPQHRFLNLLRLFLGISSRLARTRLGRLARFRFLGHGLAPIS